MTDDIKALEAAVETATCHPVDALKIYMAKAGLSMHPSVEALWRAFCDEPAP